jgi:hypothetical protein
MRITPVKRWVITGLVLCAWAAVLAWWAPWHEPEHDQRAADLVASDDLKTRQTALAKEVERYRPARPVLLDDMTAPLADTLRGLPGVDRVDVLLSPPKPRKRIVHFLYWHYVDRDLLAKVERRLDWVVYVNDVEAEQLDQAAALECLARLHGLKRVLIERLVEADMPALPHKLAQLRDVWKHQLEMKARLAEARQMLKDFPEGSERHGKAVALEREFVGRLADHRADTLKMGAAVQLLVTGRLEAVLPLDDAEMLGAAGPVLPSTGPDAAAVARRLQAMVKNALAAGPAAVIICRDAHDLTEAIREVDGETEYYRVATRGYSKEALVNRD